MPIQVVFMGPNGIDNREYESIGEAQAAHPDIEMDPNEAMRGETYGDESQNWAGSGLPCLRFEDTQANHQLSSALVNNPGDYENSWSAQDSQGNDLAVGDQVKDADPGVNDDPDQIYTITGYSYPQLKTKDGYIVPSTCIKVASADDPTDAEYDEERRNQMKNDPFGVHCRSCDICRMATWQGNFDRLCDFDLLCDQGSKLWEQEKQKTASRHVDSNGVSLERPMSGLTAYMKNDALVRAAGKYTGNADLDFEETALMPSVVIETVSEEFTSDLGKPELASEYNQYLTERFTQLYQNNQQWGEEIVADRDYTRDQLRMYVFHWAAAYAISRGEMTTQEVADYQRDKGIVSASVKRVASKKTVSSLLGRKALAMKKTAGVSGISFGEQGNDLVITISPEGQKELQQEKEDDPGNFGSDNFMWDLLEPVWANGYTQVDPSLVGALTSAPMLTDGSSSDDGSSIEPADAKVFWYPNYQVRSPQDDLLESGRTIFQGAPENRTGMKKKADQSLQPGDRVKIIGDPQNRTGDQGKEGVVTRMDESATDHPVVKLDDSDDDFAWRPEEVQKISMKKKAAVSFDGEELNEGDMVRVISDELHPSIPVGAVFTITDISPAGPEFSKYGPDQVGGNDDGKNPLFCPSQMVRKISMKKKADNQQALDEYDQRNKQYRNEHPDAESEELENMQDELVGELSGKHGVNLDSLLRNRWGNSLIGTKRKADDSFQPGDHVVFNDYSGADITGVLKEIIPGSDNTWRMIPDDGSGELHLGEEDMKKTAMQKKADGPVVVGDTVILRDGVTGKFDMSKADDPGNQFQVSDIMGDWAKLIPGSYGMDSMQWKVNDLKKIGSIKIAGNGFVAGDPVRIIGDFEDGQIGSTLKGKEGVVSNSEGKAYPDNPHEDFDPSTQVMVEIDGMELQFPAECLEKVAKTQTAGSSSQYLETFFNEKNLPHQDWEIVGNDGQTNFIDSDVVIEAIMNCGDTEQNAIADMIRKIDFANGNVLDYLKHLATGLVNGGQV
jgi:hypothetical protein